MSKFEEHMLENDFTQTYLRLFAYVQQLFSPLGVKNLENYILLVFYYILWQ